LLAERALKSKELNSRNSCERQGAGLAEVIPLLPDELAVGLVCAVVGYLLFAVFEVF
jgi:hypothetical protein